ncbi:ParB/RepB/Spo0J family partition protein [Nocardia salmonicida]|uniref:ParB/RepB/Spo0J family partition protein n=1 Tax=Nocardia salmonicida TaxID=53431 RepID=UPI0007C83E17|nr:ParB/RepB/Spo0J family partition protein [Nocardia salmonicida]
MEYSLKTARVKKSVEIESLVVFGSPRSEGEDQSHIERLIEAEWPLPPILVHRQTNRVIDGFHRTIAARRKGLTHIDAYLVDGSDELAFILGVQENVTHGLPLSLADRRAAAERIVRTHPHWSNRSIAAAAGLSAKTVASIRGGTGDSSQGSHRLGSDGRLRPVDTNSARRTAAELIMARPDASLRSIAKVVGLSPSTVRDVRARLESGADPLVHPEENKTSCTKPASESAGPAATDRLGLSSQPKKQVDIEALLGVLSRDPALRMSVGGRELLRWLHQHAVIGSDVAKIAAAVRPHSYYHVIEFANQCSANWATIAQALQAASVEAPSSSPDARSA